MLALNFQKQIFNSAGPGVKGSTKEPEFPSAPVLPGMDVEPAGQSRESSAALFGEEVSAGEPRFQHLATEAARSWRWLVDAWQ
jgi:hypothetical protein